MVIFFVLGAVWSFIFFFGFFSHFLDFGGISVLLKVLKDIFVIFRFQRHSGHFLGLWNILTFRFRGYFGHFLGFEGILVIF